MLVFQKSQHKLLVYSTYWLYSTDLLFIYQAPRIVLIIINTHEGLKLPAMDLIWGNK